MASIVGGDDKTVSFNARLLDRPHVERLTMRVMPPAYTHLDPTTLDNAQRSAQILPGSTVTISMETNKPVVTARLIAGRETVADVQPATSEPNEASAENDASRDAPAAHRRFAVTIQPTQNRTLHFALIDAYGLENRQPERLAIRMTKDDPPRVHLRLPGVGEMITSEAILPIHYEFADAYGLATAGLTFMATRAESMEDPIVLSGFEPRMKRFEGEIAWPVLTAALVPGERLAITAEARDFDTVSGPNVAQAPEVTLRCVTRDELLAELARREQEFRADFERLVDAQEQLRGQLLTALGRSHNEERSAELLGMLAPLERRQRNIAGSINVVRQQFEQILAEMRVNQLATRAVEERLGDGIIDPLTKLAKRESVIAADTIRRWARDTNPETASLIDPQQAILLSQMRNVLANMLQWEGYQEVVSMLREIIRLQNELEEETRRTIEEQAGDIFDD